MSIKSEAERAAANILEEAWDSDRFPVDPVVIAERMGIFVFEAQLPGNVSGLLRKDPGQEAEIFVDVDDPPVRRRFTTAHELGHFAQRRDQDEFVGYIDRRDGRAQEGTKPEEIFANTFGAHLLMPRSAVKVLVDARNSDVQMARFFGVSLQSMQFHLENLGYRRS
ncbi:ImmA/IrrE family metallo-endopeptidase [Curtobacterium sp. MCPF17_050]|uniref:ImmA/IrrE family metallo-endopeptidase n=1 Tax=Curtobacterium sp. MCPF17_050 TaxID=2175664 RepID=UPI000D9E90A1|nr:ImmA/IrrE family metallo-endopeptidase [Curtobacterium sp. MCPF17_050]WIB16289.1 ImmA/IrrE family metallo-endopeptidase [Curtobacterium sp. MCPF17_050]